MKNTPVEEYEISGKTIYVKREDLSSPFPGPANAKVRGVDRLLRQYAENDIRKIGVLDTKISRVGWIVSWLVHENKYDMEVYDFYPRYKADRRLRFAQKMAKYFGAKLVAQPAGRNWYRYALARKHMKEIGGQMLPDKLVFWGATQEVAEEVQHVEEDLLKGTIVVNVGSGTILSGVICGLTRLKVTPKLIVGPLCASEATTKSRLKNINGLVETNLQARLLVKMKLKLIPSRWSYYKPILVRKPPFPCDLYYDRKAWFWMIRNIEKLPEPILFWNIGGEWDINYGLTPYLRGDGKITHEKFEEFTKKLEKVIAEEN